ncbi:MAG: phosphotransferase [Candidatus Limnocylindrales bacterium]
MTGGSPWATRELADLLAANGLADVPEVPFEHDGWSGATLTALDGPGGRFILKRTSWAADWIARSTRDHALREAVLAADPVALPHPLAAAHLGAAADGTTAAILMPDLSASLIPWDAGNGGANVVEGATLERVLRAMAAIHGTPWATIRSQSTDPVAPGWPWCPVRERLELLSRASAARYAAGGLWVGERFLGGWDAFDALATPAARVLIAELTDDPSPILAALARLPPTGLHGDLKLANVALLADGRASCIDWQLTTFAPVAVELGWFLVANVAQLSGSPDETLEAYRSALLDIDAGAVIDDWGAQRDLAVLAGLLLRGWRKGLDAASGARLPTGASAEEDLRWWCEEAVAAADRRL